MPTPNPFKFLDKHTNKGAAHLLAGRSLSPGLPDILALVTSGVFVDRDTLVIGDDTYEIVDLSTDSTVDILTFWNNTNPLVTQTAIDPADYAFSLGEYVAVESEIAIVSKIVVNSATDWDVTFLRGLAGSTIVAHATGTTAIEVKEATALTAGAIPVPTIAVTAAAGLDALAAVIGNQDAIGPAFNGQNLAQNVFGVAAEIAGIVARIKGTTWSFLNLDDTTGLLYSDVIGSRAVAVDDAGLTNATTVDANTVGGAQPTSSPQVLLSRVPTAAEVSAGLMYIKVNGMHVLDVSAFVYVTATGALVAYDGTVSIVDGLNGVVSLSNGGLVDWSVNDTVVLSAYGAPVEVADLAPIA